MGGIDGVSEGLGPGALARFRIRFLVGCMGRIGLQLELWSMFDVRASVRLRLTVTVRCG